MLAKQASTIGLLVGCCLLVAGFAAEQRDVTRQGEEDFADLGNTELPSAAPLDPADVNVPAKRSGGKQEKAASSVASEEMPKEITSATANATVPKGTSTDVTVQAVQVQAQLNGINKVIKKHMSGKPEKEEAVAAKVEAKKPAAKAGAAAGTGGKPAAAKPPAT